MLEINFPLIAAVALVPLAVGFVWYNPKVLGTAWMNAAGINEETMKGANMPLIFGLTYLLSLFASFALLFMVIHQFAFISLFQDNPDAMVAGTAANEELLGLFSKFTNYRTITHGLTHGFFASMFFVLPILAINAMFERKGFKYIAINVGYWMVSLCIMGAILCAYN